MSQLEVATGILAVRNTAKYPTTHRTVTITKIIQPKTSIVPRLENPALEKKGKRINSCEEKRPPAEA